MSPKDDRTSQIPADRLKVLIVDDSAYNRQAISKTFLSSGQIEVVGTAADGNEALRLVYERKPDVITLDLEMPRMDGFSFLRVLMGSRPTPVIVVSSYSGKENVFRALELGAIDFVAKPEGTTPQSQREGFEPLLQKVLLFRMTHPSRVHVRSAVAPSLGRREMPTLVEQPKITPRFLVGIVSSTGGPSSLGLVFSQLSARANYAVLIAQHMPEKFTRTFAERLDKKSLLDVREAQQADAITTQAAFVCPGRQCMEVELTANGQYRVRLVPPQSSDRYVPSGDRLLRSIAAAARSRSIAVVLTGMGDDGVEGAKAVAAAGGTVIAESEETAVIYGMPRAVARAGIPHRSVPLHNIAEQLDQLLR